MTLPTRRDFLGTLGAAAAAVPALGSTAFGAGGQATASLRSADQGRPRTKVFKFAEPVGTLATGAHGGTLAKIDPAVHETKFAGVRI